MVTEIMQVGENGIMHIGILTDADGSVIVTSACGSCGGKSVGCVVCPNNDPILDCSTGTISCG